MILRLRMCQLFSVSAYGMEISEDSKELIDKAPFLRKPFDVDELISVIGEIVK